jgi:hypothetical protein
MMTPSARTTLKIINRDNQLDLFFNRLSAVAHEGAPVVFLFHGVPNVGKSRYLRECQARCQAQRIPVVLVDFDPEGQIWSGGRVDSRYKGALPSRKIQLANDLLLQLATTTEITATPIVPDATPETAAQAVCAYVRRFRAMTQKPTVWLFDTVDECDPELFAWLQTDILTPLLNNRWILVALAAWVNLSQSLRWALVQHLEPVALEPLSEVSTKEQIGALDPITPWLRQPKLTLTRFTGGLPGLNEKLLQASPEKMHDTMNLLVDAVLTRTLKTARPAQPKLSDDEKNQLVRVATLRQFDNRLWRRLFLSGETDAARARTQARQAIDNLRATTFVQLHSEYGYAVSRDLRRVLDTYWQVMDLRAHFDLHRQAAAWYREQVEKGDFVAVANDLYHWAGMWQDLKEDRADQLRMPEGWAVPSRVLFMVALSQHLATTMEKLREHDQGDELMHKIQAALDSPEFAWVLPNEVDRRQLIERTQI